MKKHETSISSDSGVCMRDAYSNINIGVFLFGVLQWFWLVSWGCFGFFCFKSMYNYEYLPAFFGLFSLYLLGCNWKVSAPSSLHVSLQNFSKVFLYIISKSQLHKITTAFYKPV